MSDVDPFASMTLAQLEALAARFRDAVKVITDAKALLGGGGAPAVGRIVTSNRVVSVPATPVEPYPCLACGRAGPEKPGEVAGDAECLSCGNHMPLTAGMPGVIQTNKGPMLLDPARRAQLMQQPAFDSTGEPT